MSVLKKQFAKSKDALWQKLAAELKGEFRFPPFKSQKLNVQVQHDNWKLNLSIDNEPSDPDNPGVNPYINSTGMGGVGL
jgi:hypothetical protein